MKSFNLVFLFQLNQTFVSFLSIFSVYSCNFFTIRALVFRKQMNSPGRYLIGISFTRLLKDISSQERTIHPCRDDTCLNRYLGPTYLVNRRIQCTYMDQDTTLGTYIPCLHRNLHFIIVLLFLQIFFTLFYKLNLASLFHNAFGMDLFQFLSFLNYFIKSECRTKERSKMAHFVKGKLLRQYACVFFSQS